MDHTKPIHNTQIIPLNDSSLISSDIRAAFSMTISNSSSAAVDDSANVQQSSSSLFDEISKMITLLFIPTVCTIGITGNSMGILLIQSNVYLKKLPSNRYLIGLALSSSIFLVIHFFLWLEIIFPNIAVYSSSVFACKLFTFIGALADLLCCWFIVAVCIDRLILVYWPHKRKKVTKGHAYWVIGVISFVSVLLNLWILLLATIEWEEGTGYYCGISMPWLGYYQVFNFLETMHSIVIPSMIVIMANVLVIYKLKTFKIPKEYATGVRFDIDSMATSNTNHQLRKTSSTGIPHYSSTGHRFHTSLQQQCPENQHNNGAVGNNLPDFRTVELQPNNLISYQLDDPAFGNEYRNEGGDRLIEEDNDSGKGSTLEEEEEVRPKGIPADPILCSSSRRTSFAPSFTQRKDSLSSSASKDRSSNSNNQEFPRRLGLRPKDVLVTRVLILVTFAFVCFNLPHYLCRLILTNDQSLQTRAGQLITSLAYYLYYFHHALVFFVYIFNSTQMRRQIKPTALMLLECYCLKPVPNFGHDN